MGFHGHRVYLTTLLLCLCFVIGCRREATTVTQFEPADPIHDAIQQQLEQSDIPQLMEGISSAFRLKEDLLITFQESEEGPLYRNSQIVIPYGFLARTRADLKEAGLSLTTEQLDRVVLSQIKFVLFHELGHALIDQFEIPVVGKEEDAVDGLATILAVGVVRAPEIALSAALALDASEDPEREYLQQDYWNEHSLGPQRYYNILCWVRGGAPDWHAQVARLAPEDWLESEGGECPAEYEKLVTNWGKLLRPHLRAGVVIRHRVSPH